MFRSSWAFASSFLVWWTMGTPSGGAWTTNTSLVSFSGPGPARRVASVASSGCATTNTSFVWGVFIRRRSVSCRSVITTSRGRGTTNTFLSRLFFWRGASVSGRSTTASSRSGTTNTSLWKLFFLRRASISGRSTASGWCGTTNTSSGSSGGARLRFLGSLSLSGLGGLAASCCGVGHLQEKGGGKLGSLFNDLVLVSNYKRLYFLCITSGGGGTGV